MFQFNIKLRSDLGRGASRRLRHKDLLPAVIYGNNKEAISITIDHDKLYQAAEKKEFFSSTIDLKNGDTVEKVKIQDIQRHPFKEKLLHADFLRV